MTQKDYTTVLLPIQILPGPYCHDGKKGCPQFQNPEGVGECLVGFQGIEFDRESEKYVTPKECRQIEKQHERHKEA